VFRENKTGSPFNVHEPTQAPMLTLAQLQSMFKQYQESYGVHVDADVVEDVLALTSGHSGLVQLCGDFIQKTLVGPKFRTRVTMNEWNDPEKAQMLELHALNWKTAERVKEHLESNAEDFKFVREFCLPSTGRIPVPKAYLICVKGQRCRKTENQVAELHQHGKLKVHGNDNG